MGEKTTFNGVTYYRYPDKGRHYFRSRISGRTVQLQRAVWESVNGPILPEHEVHHIDGNPANNAIDNLKCLTRREHKKLHWATDFPVRLRARA